jgi:hypothetical protein
MPKKQKSIFLAQVILITSLIALALLFLAIVRFNGRAIAEMDQNAQLCSSLSRYASPEQNEKFSYFCSIHLNSECTKDCGPFPCYENKCLIKPCNSNSECPTKSCGQEIKNFCS